MVEKSEPFKLKIFQFSMFIVYVSYFLTFLGVIYVDKSKIRLFSIFIQLIICFILILRFNPFRNHKMTDFDKTIIFSASFFMFINLFITEIYSQFSKWSYDELNELFVK